MLTEVEVHPFEFIVHPLMGIRWMVHWWVLVHSGCLKLLLNYESWDGLHLGCWAKTGDESNSQDENSKKERAAEEEEEEGTKLELVFSPQLVLTHTSFTPQFWIFAIPVVPSPLLVSFIKSSLCKILQILWTDTQFPPLGYTQIGDETRFMGLK
jgi:hypothetical protein